MRNKDGEESMPSFLGLKHCQLSKHHRWIWRAEGAIVHGGGKANNNENMKVNATMRASLLFGQIAATNGVTSSWDQSGAESAVCSATGFNSVLAAIHPKAR